MNAWFLVFLGGGLGSLLRFGIARLLIFYKADFPLATFSANLISCVLLGTLFAWQASRPTEDATLKWLLMTGFCGGFSTFSTFTGETYFLLEQQLIGWALLYVSLSLVICGLGFYLGYQLFFRF